MYADGVSGHPRGDDEPSSRRRRVGTHGGFAPSAVYARDEPAPPPPAAAGHASSSVEVDPPADTTLALRPTDPSSESDSPALARPRTGDAAAVQEWARQSLARILTELQVVYGHFEGLDMLVELATRVAETRDRLRQRLLTVLARRGGAKIDFLQQAFDSVF